LLGAACPISQSEEGEGVLSETPCDGTDRTEASGFQRIIPGDESWFFRRYLCDSVWAASGDEVSQRIKQKIDTEKCLVSNLWSVNGIPSLFDVSRGTTYNTAFFTDAGMPSLIENIRSRTRMKTMKC
jgi:hypothetical protein